MKFNIEINLTEREKEVLYKTDWEFGEPSIKYSTEVDTLIDKGIVILFTDYIENTGYGLSEIGKQILNQIVI